MYSQIDAFAIDKQTNALVEEGIAPVYIREYYRRQGKKVLNVRKNLADLAGSRAHDLVDSLGCKWEVKADRIFGTTGNVYIELQALEASQADMYIIFAGCPRRRRCRYRPCRSRPLMDLKPIERAKWIELTTAFSWLRVEHRDALYIYCSLWGDWIEARTRLAATGGPVIKGTGTKLFMDNPYVAQARDAMEGLLSMQNGMLFVGTTEGRKVVREMGRLQKFLADAPR